MFAFLAPLFKGIAGSALGKAATTLGTSAFGKSLAQGLGTAAASRLSGGGGGSSQTSRINFAQMRDDAIAAGFNPLTALRATGGAGNVTTSIPSMSSGDFLKDALGQGLTHWFNSPTAYDKEMDQLRLETAREELNQLRRASDPVRTSFGKSLTDVEDYRTPANTSPFMRPQPRPTATTQKRIPVFLPDGQTAKIPATMAERLGIKPWHQMAAEDYAGVVGDIRGEGENILNIDAIGENMGLHWWKGPIDMKPPTQTLRGDRRN